MRIRWFVMMTLVVMVAAGCAGESADVSTTVADVGVAATSTPDVSTTSAASAENEVTIVMTDFAFEPAVVDVAGSETWTFTFVNEGQIEHEARIDTLGAVEEHIAGGHDAHEHGEGPLSLILQPGESGSLTVTFEEGDYFEVIACTLPGHFEAGMVAELTGLAMPEPHSVGAEVTIFDPEDAEAVAAQTQTVGILAAIDLVDSAGFHGMSEALAGGELSGRELGRVQKVLTALDVVAWPHELEETVGALMGDLGALAAALEAEDVNAAAEAAHAVHESQHGFSHDVYAFLAGGSHPHGSDMMALSSQMQTVGILTAIDFVDSAGFHGMAEALAGGELSGRELGGVQKVLTALDVVAWPHELEETVGALMGDLGALAAALEAEDVNAAAEAAHAVHEGQHGFSHDVYAFLDGGAGEGTDDMHLIADQSLRVGILKAIDFVDSAGFHGMAEALDGGELSGRELGGVQKVIAAVSGVAWPDELAETVSGFLGDVEALAIALEAEDVNAAAEAAHAVHESQHGLSHDVYGFLSDGHH